MKGFALNESEEHDGCKLGPRDKLPLTLCTPGVPRVILRVGTLAQDGLFTIL